MEEDHYDAIYEKEQIVTAGFCQCKKHYVIEQNNCIYLFFVAIVYTIFYERVFSISNVDDIVRNMLYDKNNLITLSEWMKPEVKNDQEKDANKNDLQLPLDTPLAPFPFKVAKALDPNIYRNIEYDSWGETRRGNNYIIFNTLSIEVYWD